MSRSSSHGGRAAARRGAFLLAPLVAVGLALVAPATAAAPQPVSITVLSSRADLVSGGDALVRVAAPAGVTPSGIRVRIAGRDVTKSFAMRPNGHYEGLVTGLASGRNVVTATAGSTSDTTVITNHPNGGPVLSGPQLQPWVCQPTAVDALCNQPAEYSFLYKSSNPALAGLRPYDPQDPPPDVATTVTDQGVSVPFIVRLEVGYQDRDQYKILQLFQPGQPWQPWAPQRQWNRKVLIPHGGGCGYSHGAGEAPLKDYSGTYPVDVPGVENSYVTALGRGFAVMSTALNNLGHNCNLVTAAESMLMAKERLVEQYGEIRYTIGTGCSGGSITQNTVANAYPGIYQGLITSCTYPDAVTTLGQFIDLHLLRLYFEQPQKWGPGVVWSPTQFAAVEGHGAHVNAVVADEAFTKPLSDPENACHGVSDEQRYDSETNPGGTRCVLMDYMINVFGPRPERAWGPQEREIGRGFGGLPLGNQGVQYGLQALQQGLITPAQFADLNAVIGGLDIDGQLAPMRTAGDQGALRNAYRSGAINVANNLENVAIINHGGPDPGAAHDYGHAFWVRARLEREQGHFDNHVMWFGSSPLIGDQRWANEALVEMDRWLTAVEADTSAASLPDKITGNRPADLQDRCSNLPGLELVDVPGVGKVCEQPLVQTHFGTPRTVAGGPVTNDVNACALRPLRRTDYVSVFSDPDWARLQAAFPNGVCDYSRQGIGQGATVTWQTYQDCRGAVLYGGQPLGSAPARTGPGWTSASFRDWTRTEQGRSDRLARCDTTRAPDRSSGPSGDGPFGRPAGVPDPPARSSSDVSTSPGDASPAGVTLASTGPLLPLAPMAALVLLAVASLIARGSARTRED